MNKGRLEAFTDAIVAIAATIMVLQLTIPTTPDLQGLSENAAKFVAYLVSFLMIYVGWFAHHNLFKKAEHITTRTFIINGFWIFLCSLVPFTAAWVGHAADAVVPEVLYHANLLLWRISFQLLDRQILMDNPHAASDSSRDVTERIGYYISFALCIIIDFFKPIWGLYLTVVMTAVMVIRSFTSREANEHGKWEGKPEVKERITMPRQSIFEMKVSKVYPMLIAKAERKGRTKAEVDQVTEWLTGYDMATVNLDVTYAGFFANAPAMNPRAELIKGSICGIKVEEIEDPLMQKIRWLDKLVDELSKGKPMEKVLR